MSTTTIDDQLADVRRRIERLRARAADVAEDRAAFVSAMDAELRSWDTYLERLQMSVAAKASVARERSETAIGRIRACRIAVDEHLSQLRADGGDAWPRERRRVTEAREDLERTADALSAELTRTKSNPKEQAT